MGIIVGVLLALLSVGVVIYPFLKARQRARLSVVPARTGAQDAAFNDIRTLQLEYQLGRVDEEEYQARLSDYRILAASLLREQDLKSKEVDAAVEAEILAARAAALNQGRDLNPQEPDDALEAEVSAARSEPSSDSKPAEPPPAESFSEGSDGSDGIAALDESHAADEDRDGVS